MAEKKKFFSINLEMINQKADLYDTSEDNLVGKTIKIDLTRKLRGKSCEIIFKIKKQDNKLIAQPSRLHILGYFIRRIIRKSANYVEDSFQLESKNAVLRAKPFLITRKKVSRAIRTALRNKAKEELITYAKERNYEEIFYDLLDNKLQKELSLKLKKIYPLAFCDIRDIFVIKEKPQLEIKEEKIKA